MSLAPAVLIALAAADADSTPICTDRPAKANAVCTVPKERLQLESTALGWSRTESGGATATLLSAGSSVIKYGLSDRSDLQVAFTPYVHVKTRDATGTSRISGFGDIVVRYKHRLTERDAPVQAALLPFAKLPTARRGIGNRRLEGGLAVPVSFGLGGGISATLGPELDLVADSDGHGWHAALINLVNLSAEVAPRLTLAGEFWSNLNFDPAGTIRQASADAALAYAASSNLQLDFGASLGLTRDTPDTEIYAGISIRF